MCKELCFCIENEDLFLEQVLVDYRNIPIFFLCSSKQYYYIALCTDIDELTYVVTQVSMLDVYRLLHGKIPMRDVILKQKEYWNVISGEEICSDIVTKYPVNELDISVLPQENACFKVLTQELENFVHKFDVKIFNDIYSDKNFLVPTIEKTLQTNVTIEIIERFGIVTELNNYEIPSLLLKNEYYKEAMEKFKNVKSVKTGLQKCDMPLIWASDDLYDVAIAV